MKGLTMQLNLVQFLSALAASFPQVFSSEAGIVTLESGDTFDVKANIQGLQSLLMCASHDLKDADKQLTQFVSNDDQDEPYYNETRKQLVAVREGLEAIDTAGSQPVALASLTILGEIAVLASAFKDVINSAENGQGYTFEELTGPSFTAARDVMSKYDPENPEQVSSAQQPALTTPNSDLKVSLDGGVTYQPAPSGVRILYDNVAVIGEDEPGQVHINATSEGIITDVWVSREAHLDHNIGTSQDTAEGIAADLVEENL